MHRILSSALLNGFVLAAACGAAACDVSTTSSSQSSSGRPPNASVAIPEPPKPRSAKLTKALPKVGNKEAHRKTKEEKSRVAFKGPKGGVDVESTETSTVEKTEECLEVVDAVCRKLKVSYAIDAEEKTTTTRLVTLDGAPDPKDKPKPPKVTKRAGANQGNVYIVTRDAKSPIILREDGKKVNKAEEDAIRGAYRDDGTRDKRFLAALPDEVKIGDSLDAFAKLMAEEMKASASTVNVKDIIEVDGKVVVILSFHIETEGQNNKRFDQMKSVVDGTIEVLADGALDQKSDIGMELKATLPRKGGELKSTIKTRETKAVLP